MEHKSVDVIMKELQLPFPAEDIEWRVQSSGISNGKAWALIMPYVTSRAIQQRLDDVVGADRWGNSLAPISQESKMSFIAGIAIKFGSEWVTKYDGADETTFENFKGGISNAMKRAGVEWGIGRYLYRLDVQFAELKEDRNSHFKAKIDGRWFSYDFPPLPSWALPEGSSNPTRTVVDEHDKIIKENLGGRNLTEEANNCKTLQELQVWYNNLPKDMKTVGMPAVAVKDNRKEELFRASEQLKEMKVVQLKNIAGKKSIANAGKMSKADLVNAILKAINS